MPTVVANLLAALDAAEREREYAEALLEDTEREQLGFDGRCPVGHNKRLTGRLAGKNICVACERDEARAALAAREEEGT